MNRQREISQNLECFVQEYAADVYMVSLLLFFAAFPFTRFDKLAILDSIAPEKGKYQARLALDKLVSLGLVEISGSTTSPLYGLSETSAIRQMVIEFGTLTRTERQLLLNKVYSGSVLTKQAVVI